MRSEVSHRSTRHAAELRHGVLAMVGTIALGSAAFACERGSSLPAPIQTPRVRHPIARYFAPGNFDQGKISIGLSLSSGSTYLIVVPTRATSNIDGLAFGRVRVSVGTDAAPESPVGSALPSVRSLPGESVVQLPPYASPAAHSDFKVSSSGRPGTIGATKIYESDHFAFYQDDAEPGSARDFAQVGPVVESRLPELVATFGLPGGQTQRLTKIRVLNTGRPGPVASDREALGLIAQCGVPGMAPCDDASAAIVLLRGAATPPEVVEVILHETIHLSQRNVCKCSESQIPVDLREGAAAFFSFDSGFPPTAAWSIARVRLSQQNLSGLADWIDTHHPSDSRGAFQVTANTIWYPYTWGSIFARWLEETFGRGVELALERAFGLGGDPLDRAVSIPMNLARAMMFGELAGILPGSAPHTRSDFGAEAFPFIDLGPRDSHEDDRGLGGVFLYRITPGRQPVVTVEAPGGAYVILVES